MQGSTAGKAGGKRRREEWERRRRWGEQAVIDRAVLAWIGRFRFVTTAMVAVRFEVSERQARARLQRLEGMGLVVRERVGVGGPGAVYLSRDGMAQVGIRPRKAPRLDIQRRHELAIVEWVARVETGPQAGEVTVFSERDCHRLEADGVGTFHIETRDGADKKVKRWPDALIQLRSGPYRAIEFEFAAKTISRLERIIGGYLDASWLDVVFFYVESAALARRITHIARTHGVLRRRAALGLTPHRVKILIRPAHTAPADEREKTDARTPVRCPVADARGVS